MTEVPSVNPEQHEIPESESAGKPWVDPIFMEQNPERLPDEPEPTPEEIAAQKAEEAKAEEADRKANGTPTKKELAALIAALPEDDEAEEAKAGEEPDKAAEEAKEEVKAEEVKAEKPKSDESKPEENAEEALLDRRKRRELERAKRLRELEAENAQLKQQIPPKTEPAEEAVPQPKLEDFDYDTEKWATALGEWTQKEIAAGQARAEEAKRREAAQQAFKVRQEAFDEREEAARDLYDDYDDIAHDNKLPITDAMAEVIFDSNLGPQIAYHLGKNREEAGRIAMMNPLAQAKALGQIEARFEAEEAKAKAAEEAQNSDKAEEAESAEEAKTKSQPQSRPTPTKAPEPIPTVGGGGATARRDPSRMSMEDYEEGRRSGKIR